MKQIIKNRIPLLLGIIYGETLFFLAMITIGIMLIGTYSAYIRGITILDTNYPYVGGIFFLFTGLWLFCFPFLTESDRFYEWMEGR